MAKRVQVVLEDDVDGSPADETVSFGLDGVSYEIDLSAENASALRDQLAKWIGAAQRTGGRRAAGRRAGARRDGLTFQPFGRGHGPTATRSTSVAGCRRRSRRPTTRHMPDRAVPHGPDGSHSLGRAARPLFHWGRTAAARSPRRSTRSSTSVAVT